MNPEVLCMRCMGRLNKPDESCPHCGASPLEYVNAANQLECGSILAGTYLVGCVLGQGGFGITYIGLDLNLNLKVAIKEYYPEGYVTREGQTHSTVLPLPGERRTLFERGKEKFVSEAQILAKFNEDASIVGVRGFFQENGTVYIVMNFVEGETLKEFATKRGGKIPAMEVLAMMEPLFESLSKVHAAGLLHRDISPDNIMRRKNGSIVLLDFGAARQMSIDGEHSNTINVKHGFAPEEQYRTHGEQGPWTDVYALCATIYRLTTGVTPQQALDRAMSNTTLLPPNKLGADFSIPEEQAILHGLAVRADQRIQDIKQLRKELKGDKPYTISGNNSEKPTGQSKGDINPAQFYSPKRKWPVRSITFAVISVVIVILAFSLLFTQMNAGNKTETATGAAVVMNENEGKKATEIPIITPKPTVNPFPLTYETVRTGVLAAGVKSVILLKSDGTVVCLGDEKIKRDTNGWKDIIQVAEYDDFAVGLCKDGTIKLAGNIRDPFRKANDWRDIVQVDCGEWHILGVTSDGFVKYTGEQAYSHGMASCETEWKDVKQVLAGSNHIAAIMQDGTVESLGWPGEDRLNTKKFTNVITGDIGNGSTFCVTADGKVLDTGENSAGENSVDLWSKIVAVAAVETHTVGLRSDGTVVVAGPNINGENNTEDWRDIIAIAAGDFRTIGVRNDGKVFFVGLPFEENIDINDIWLW